MSGCRLRFAMLVLLCVGAVPALSQEDPAYTETMTVVRYLVDVRVLDAAHRAVTDLTASDFAVTIAGRPAEVESAHWVGSVPAASAVDSSEQSTGARPKPAAGRALVLFIHTDFARNPTRVMGQLKFNVLAEEILKLLEPADRVAVVQHDSHLTMRLDFSNDLDAIRKAIRDSMRTRAVPLPVPAGGPSLARQLDAEAMKRSATADCSLLLVAEALRAIPGSKALVLAGWGIGELQPGRGVVLSKTWREAVAVFRRDGVPIITISTGLEGGQLTLGLVASSRATGGAYAGTTHSFPQQTAARVAGALAGYYELVLRANEPLSPGEHPVAFRAHRRGITVIAPPTLMVAPPGTEEEAGFVAGQPVPDASAVANTDARSLFSRAMALLRNGDAGGVAGMLTEVIAMDPGFAPAWYERGMLAAGRGEIDAAHADLRKYLELDPRGTHAGDVREMLRLHYRP